MTAASDSDLDRYVRAVLGRKAQGVVVLDVAPLTSMAETFIIGSGRSNRQVTAIAEHVRSALKERGIRPLNVEGLKDGHWVLMDYGHVIIHLFHEPLRSFYDLEGLWADARHLRPPALAEQERAGTAEAGEARPEELGDD